MKPALPVGTIVSYLGIKAVVVEDGPTGFLVLCEGNYENWSWELDGHTCEIVAYPSDSGSEALELARRTPAMAALEGEVMRRIDAAYRKQGGSNG